MKKIITFALITLTFGLLNISNVSAEVFIEGDAEVKVGESITLTASNVCDDEEDEECNEDATIVWSSEDSNIATVSASGVVTGVSAGDVTITASEQGDDTNYDSIIVTVTANDESGSGSETGGSGTGGSETGGSETGDSDDDLYLIIFRSNQDTITINALTRAVVDSQSVVDPGYTIQFEAKICNENSAMVSGDYITYIKSSCTDATDVKWKSSDTSVLTVSDTGLVTFKEKGQSTITATSGDYSWSLIYRVGDIAIVNSSKWVRLFIVDPSTKEVTYNGVTSGPFLDKMLDPGETLQLKAVICKDADANVSGETLKWNVDSDCTVVNPKWSTNSTSEITVDSNGLVTAKKGGSNWDNVYATVDSSTLGLASDENFDYVHNGVSIYVKGFEYKKVGSNAQTTFDEDVYTTSNPATGLHFMLLLVPSSIATGSYLIFKRKRYA